ncbi:EAL domain-containing protein [Thalassotalea nanhaiensis]|uniref:EAL domain-containing protein n=1 Tax=Thalassotalea nanhaiensis TaxID=3065648 RepID=A0ABY9TMC9_9GAMM|nr:EAL domain-containing protein [Colwelliaceae bacterium SQ345]
MQLNNAISIKEKQASYDVLKGFAARQSIVDKNNKIFAYELLFRDSLINVCPDIDANLATVQLIQTTLKSRQSKTFTNQKPAFINFTLETLQKGYPQQFDAKHVIVEILETEQPCSKLLTICKDLHEKGYCIALDDFVHHQQWHDFFPFIKIIKVDFRQSSIEEIIELIEHLADFPHIQLLAEKVENQQEYKQAINLGFDFFQGFFFDKPEVIKSNPNNEFALDLSFA